MEILIVLAGSRGDAVWCAGLGQASVAARHRVTLDACVIHRLVAYLQARCGLNMPHRGAGVSVPPWRRSRRCVGPQTHRIRWLAGYRMQEVS
jgi:hypothetical protein